MLSVASARSKERVRTGPKSSAIITAPGEKCGLVCLSRRTIERAALVLALLSAVAVALEAFGEAQQATTPGQEAEPAAAKDAAAEQRQAPATSGGSAGTDSADSASGTSGNSTDQKDSTEPNGSDTTTESGERSREIFVPSEEISEDIDVPFPVDI